VAEYSLFVSFFPLLVAGPIERAKHLLPQIQSPRVFDYKKAADGLRQILWGLFKKVVVADNCAHDVNIIFNHPESYRGSTLFYGAVLFVFQIYCDFSGYSDMAIGTARLFGFDLVRNFSYPYFSRNLGEFWRRWNISVSTWFRDYLYTPMGGRYGKRWQQARNALVMFTLIGFWHGANWTFLLFGLFNGIIFLAFLIRVKSKRNSISATDSISPRLKEVGQILTTFLLITIGGILFRAANLQQAVSYFKGLFSWSFFTQPQMFSNIVFKSVVIMLIIEWLQRNKQHGLQIENIRYAGVRWGIYIGLLYFVCYFPGAQQGFIYFQF
jgi:alginate O-acetyltransferase complex protein AlgI